MAVSSAWLGRPAFMMVRQSEIAWSDYYRQILAISSKRGLPAIAG
jgi:hypothetical protein